MDGGANNYNFAASIYWFILLPTKNDIVAAGVEPEPAA